MSKIIPTQLAENNPRLLTGIGDDRRSVGWGGKFTDRYGNEYENEQSEHTDKYFEGIGNKGMQGHKAIAKYANASDDTNKHDEERKAEIAKVVNELKGEDLQSYAVDNELEIDFSKHKNDKALRLAIINYKS